MADEKADAKPKAEAANKKSKLPILIIAVLMGVEGVGVFFVAKMFVLADPASVEAVETGDEYGDERTEDAQPTAEVEITDCRPSNKVTGKLITFRLRVSALVAASEAEHAVELVRANSARLTDRVNYVIRSAEPQHLNEPGLETIKRRLKKEFDRILGDEQLIKEVLIPELLQSGPGV